VILLNLKVTEKSSIYFSKCFLDVFVLKKRNAFYVDFVQIRSIKLNGMLDKNECLQEIDKKFNILKK